MKETGFFSQEIFDPSNPKISWNNFLVRNGLTVFFLYGEYASAYYVRIQSTNQSLVMASYILNQYSNSSAATTPDLLVILISRLDKGWPLLGELLSAGDDDYCPPFSNKERYEVYGKLADVTRVYTENASFRPFVHSPRLLFLTFNIILLVANPKKLLYTVANPAIIVIDTNRCIILGVCTSKYVCILVTNSRVWINPVRLSILLVLVS